MTFMISSAHNAPDDGRVRWNVGSRHLIALTVSVMISAIGHSLPDAIPGKQSAYFVGVCIAAIAIYAMRSSSHRNISALIVGLLLLGTVAINLYNVPSLPRRSSFRLADLGVVHNNEKALFWLRDRLKGAVVLTEPGVPIPTM